MPVQDHLEQLCINTIRTLAMDGVQNAKSGHPGMPMGMAAPAYVLWTKILRHNPSNPNWPDRDRFVLSAGHGSMLLYALLFLCGYDLPLEELKRFRQWGSHTPGHPERGETPGVELTTGPLGQGFATGVGMAIAARHLAARVNAPSCPVVDHYIYGIVSDGDLMEGVSAEAASLAGHLGLGNLIYLYDDNRITIEGSTALAFTEDVGSRFEAYGWHVQSVDGLDLKAVETAIRAAQQDPGKPSLICVRTTIAYGSPNKAGTAEAHGSPLGEEEVRQTKMSLGWPSEEPFFVPEEALSHFRQAIPRGLELEEEWQRKINRLREVAPDKFALWQVLRDGGLSADWERQIPDFSAEQKPLATREASGKVLSSVFAQAPGLVGGSADLSPSNNTFVKGFGEFSSAAYDGRNLHFGVREHAMAAIMNGMALHGGLIPYGGTFLVFSDYMRPSIRLAAMMGAHVIYVWTHDSIGLGEDGPTHQPVEHVAALRTIPGLVFIRPSDATETAEAWRAALRHRIGPVGLALTRQKLPVLDRRTFPSADGLHRGAYILAEANTAPPEVVLLASGSEVSVALAARERLQAAGVASRVVSMPCWEFFAAQTESYRESVIPSDSVLRVSIEAGSTFGWDRWVGEDGLKIGLDRFGASAPYQVLYREFGITAEAVTERVLERLKSRTHGVPAQVVPSS